MKNDDDDAECRETQILAWPTTKIDLRAERASNLESAAEGRREREERLVKFGFPPREDDQIFRSCHTWHSFNSRSFITLH